ncbi:MAG TPA: stage II sporulation protein M, partial [Gemmatimonadales bacterium]|nr:stage II sporulation protein M [Gemmatimonadales bacterium]
ADLARLRTYGAPAPLLSRVERLAAAGHSALYRADDQAWRRLGPILLRECPAAVVRAKWSVLLAVALLAGSTTAGYLALRERPALAEEVLPDVMLQRAAAAHRRTAQGLTYAEADEETQGALAAYLMTHNIGVAVYCFAGGILLGIGSLFLLISNGASLGASFGHFVNVGAGHYLLSFILGHGVLELTAICIAAAAGLRLGLALWAPGDLTRGEAVALSGRLTLRMIGAAATLLVVAGTIEGLASATGASFAYRAGLASASAVFLVLYLVNGARWAATIDAP